MNVNARGRLEVHTYRSGVPGLEKMAVELTVSAAWVVGNKCKLRVGRAGRGERDPP